MQKVKWGIQRARQNHAMVVSLPNFKETYTVLEIFAGRATMTQVARNRAGWRAMDPVDLYYGYDIRNAHTRLRIMEAIRENKRDLVTLSPRCGPWSQFQRLNPNIDQIMLDRKPDLSLWRFAREVWDEQTKH